MKLKSKVLTVIITVAFLFTGTTIRAQGFYNNGESVDDKTETTDAKSSDSGGGIFRDDGWGGDGDDRDPDPEGKEPIGEGIVILSLLAGGYALIKKNIKRKYED